MLTGAGITLLMGSSLAYLAGRLLGVAELYVLAVTAAALVVVALLYVRFASTAVAVRRSASQTRLVAGQRIRITLELRNDAPLPGPVLLVEDRLTAWWAGAPDDGSGDGEVLGRPRFVVGGLAGDEQVRLSYALDAPVRGRYQLGPVQVRVRDPFGIAQRVRRYASTDELVVYPKLEPLPGGVLHGLHRGGGASPRRRLFATGDEFYTMREYVRGDDLRNVHWPSTAHRQRLMVRQQEQPWQLAATVLVDLRRDAHRGSGVRSSLERGVSAAASLVAELGARGYDVRLISQPGAGRILPEPPGALLDRLAVAQPVDAAGLAGAVPALRAGEGLLVAVIAPPPGAVADAEHPDLRTLQAGARGYVERVALVCAAHARDERAATTVRLLRAGGWKAATLAPDEPLAARWDDATRQPGDRARHVHRAGTR